MVLAGHYGFTAEELDFIPSVASGQALNYDMQPRKLSGQVTASAATPGKKRVDPGFSPRLISDNLRRVKGMP